MPSPIWTLLKGFIPIFRFFEAGEILPVLEVRTEDSENAWTVFLKRTPVHLGSLFHNPQQNLNLYLYSMVHECVQNHLDNRSNSFAQKKLLQVLRSRYPQFQYRIRNSLSGEVILTSGWIHAEPY